MYELKGAIYTKFLSHDYLLGCSGVEFRKRRWETADA